MHVNVVCAAVVPLQDEDVALRRVLPHVPEHVHPRVAHDERPRVQRLELEAEGVVLAGAREGEDAAAAKPARAGPESTVSTRGRGFAEPPCASAVSEHAWAEAHRRSVHSSGNSTSTSCIGNARSGVRSECAIKRRLSNGLARDQGAGGSKTATRASRRARRRYASAQRDNRELTGQRDRPTRRGKMSFG